MTQNNAYQLALPIRKIGLTSVLSITILLFSSCVYQFTNTHVGRMPGLRTVAIESIYDTSSESLPHEVLWEALQRAFAADGHLRVVSRTEADVLVRAHITDGSVTPSAPVETNSKNPDDRDPDVFEGGNVPRPSAYKRLSIAREQATKETMAVKIVVEAWQMHTGKLIFSKAYGAARTFDSSRIRAPLTYNYIRHEEALTNQFDIATNTISDQVVRDFLATTSAH